MVKQHAPYTESYIWDNTHVVGAGTTFISLSLYAHYSASIHFLPKLFGTWHLFVILNIRCKFRLILWEFIFFFLPELKFSFKANLKRMFSIIYIYVLRNREAESAFEIEFYCLKKSYSCSCHACSEKNFVSVTTTCSSFKREMFF